MQERSLAASNNLSSCQEESNSRQRHSSLSEMAGRVGNQLAFFFPFELSRTRYNTDDLSAHHGADSSSKQRVFKNNSLD